MLWWPQAYRAGNHHAEPVTCIQSWALACWASHKHTELSTIMLSRPHAYRGGNHHAEPATSIQSWASTYEAGQQNQMKMLNIIGGNYMEKKEFLKYIAFEFLGRNKLWFFVKFIPPSAHFQTMLSIKRKKQYAEAQQNRRNSCAWK